VTIKRGIVYLTSDSSTKPATMKSRMTARNNNTFNHSRFVILLRRKFTKSQTSPINPTPIESAASRKEGGPDGTGPRVTSASLLLAFSWTVISS
jgi:hypothetical protein